MDCLREMAREGRSAFFSSHTLSEVETLCERVAIIRDGRIVSCEQLETLRRQAPRVVHVTFESAQAAAAIEWPEYIRLQSQHGSRCELHMDGAATDLVDWAATQPLADIDVSPPNLEAVFRQFYGDQSGAAR